MKFAIKHAAPNYYLEKDIWNWINELTESTVYTGAELVERLASEEFQDASMREEVQVIAVQAESKYNEVK